jgi:hypothetical protein
MDGNLEQRIAELEEKLWREFRTVVALPDRVPEAMRLQLMEEAYAEVRVEGNDPFDDDCPLCRMMAEEASWTRHYDFCSGWCPDCPILEWCDTAAEEYPPEEIAWMKAHGDYPPGGGPADGVSN